ncbi:PH domain-containing protein [Xanthomonas prunicola]|uniref:PH domain-containing protein n=1 Tax=Xanthomonas prunicola TaxID=2053930 RepID=A0A9Q9MQ46_9XANT|nr:PH domain-containing protein [Xanthomonas prunicola]USI98909.1 PH domain-containing protein [Xanthomonas prunicola]UXA47324.1 PH domain-containing protein [Xanthomonas prunicola]UXA54820.1 PH domain-containing protein [Xanthomonas prunicola]UXA55785.1 PH domain-containing protein [Xanthomonas prunicola]UXA61742.1 PH domain-containing protein [Xanthomonas prunicola]
MDALAQFLTDEQDPVAVGKILPKVTELLTRDEQVEYIAVQKKMVMNLSPDAVVLTNRRFIVVYPKLFGMTFRDFPWREVLDVHMSEQMLGATIMCRTTQGAYASIDSLPKKQARRVYAYAQQVEESAYEKRQQLEIDKLRAAAGGVVVHAPGAPGTAVPSQPTPAPATDDPIQVLSKLKQLLDAGLITQDEFDAKKTEVLGRL